MTSIDDKIKQALSEEFNEIIDENDKFNSSIIKQFSAGFKGKMKKGYRRVYFFIILFYSICAYCTYKFYFAQDIKLAITYATFGLFIGIAAMLGESWYFAEMGRNRVIREIKLVELQLAQVIKNQDK